MNENTNECRHCKVAEAQGATHVHSANEWREEVERLIPLHKKLAYFDFLKDSPVYNDPDCDCSLYGHLVDVVDKIVIEALDQRTARIVERIEGLKYVEPQGDRGKLYNQVLDQIIDIINNKTE
jgi:hypothetical protein